MSKGNIEKLLGSPFTPDNVKPLSQPAPVEEQIESAMFSAGVRPPSNIIFDGKIHRFDGDKNGDKVCWYILFSDGIPAGRFGNWKTGLDFPWRADIGRKLSPIEEMAHARRMAEAKSARDAETKKQREATEVVVSKIWASCSEASPDHPYLLNKGVMPHGARITTEGRLVLPLYDAEGDLASLQYIDHNGGKLFHPGAQVGGRFWWLGTFDDPGAVYVAEGFATAATIYQATGRPCFVAYNASNLPAVAVAARERMGAAQDIVVVGDNDESGVGQKYAQEAATKASARLVIPPEPGDANDYAAAGLDLRILLEPPKTDWIQRAADFASAPAPISWMVKRWLQSSALIMVHGPSGGGKTFLVIDWCMHIAAGVEEWMGLKVRRGPVVYLAGEGHHGLKGRVAAWMTHHKVIPEDMWLSRSGCDLNQPAGYSKVVDEITAQGIAPRLIVVDTLHRFLAGDENSAQDAKSMLDACNGLMAHFNCSVLLVHHTGVSEEAQHRARGSSAWRGALDIEISVVPGKDDLPIQVIQRKSKDAEIAPPVYVKLHQVEVPGWVDEDGEPVTSAVITPSEMEPPKAFNEKLTRNMSELRDAWLESGCEQQDGFPYVSRAFLKVWLGKKHEDWNGRKIENNLSPSKDYTGMWMGSMLAAGITQLWPSEKDPQGWTIVDPALASEMFILANWSKNDPA